jgi:hypothetical protein
MPCHHDLDPPRLQWPQVVFKFSRCRWRTNVMVQLERRAHPESLSIPHCFLARLDHLCFIVVISLHLGAWLESGVCIMAYRVRLSISLCLPKDRGEMAHWGQVQSSFLYTLELRLFLVLRVIPLFLFILTRSLFWTIVGGWPHARNFFISVLRRARHRCADLNTFSSLFSSFLCTGSDGFRTAYTISFLFLLEDRREQVVDS